MKQSISTILLFSALTVGCESFTSSANTRIVMKTSSQTTLSASAAATTLKPPMSTEEMLSHEGETARLYDDVVQKTYGYVFWYAYVVFVALSRLESYIWNVTFFW